VLGLGAVHKRRPHKSVKNWPFFFTAKCPHWLKTFPPFPTCPCDTPKFSKNPKFLLQKVRTSVSEEAPSPLVRKLSALDKLSFSLTADVFYGRPLSAKCCAGKKVKTSKHFEILLLTYAKSSCFTFQTKAIPFVSRYEFWKSKWS